MTVAAVIPGPQQPFAAAGAAILGAISGQKAQTADQNAVNEDTGREKALIGSLAGSPWLQPVLNAEASGVNTLKSQVGGVPNIGDLAKTLLGGDLQTAISAGLGQRASNLSTAIGDTAGLASAATTAAGAQGNPWGNLAAGFSGLPNLFGPKPTGTSGTPSPDVWSPAAGGPQGGINPGSGLWTGPTTT